MSCLGILRWTNSTVVAARGDGDPASLSVFRDQIGEVGSALGPLCLRNSVPATELRWMGVQAAAAAAAVTLCARRLIVVVGVSMSWIVEQRLVIAVRLQVQRMEMPVPRAHLCMRLHCIRALCVWYGFVNSQDAEVVVPSLG